MPPVPPETANAPRFSNVRVSSTAACTDAVAPLSRRVMPVPAMVAPLFHTRLAVTLTVPSPVSTDDPFVSLSPASVTVAAVGTVIVAPVIATAPASPVCVKPSFSV